MPAEVESMAYTGLVPWHGLGTRVSQDMPPEEFLIAAGLDWEVNKIPLYSADGLRFIDHAGLVRTFHDGTVEELGICGKQYIPTQNKDAFGFFNRFCENTGLILETCGSLQGGRQLWALAKIPGGFTVMKGDDVEQYLLLSHPHVWGKSLVFKFTPIRVVCMNTLMMALKGGADFRMQHIYAFDGVMQRQAHEILDQALVQMREFKEAAAFLASKPITDESLFRYIGELFQPDLLKEQTIAPDMFKRNAHRILELNARSPGSDLKSASGTWWGAANAVTYFYDHEYGQSADGRLNNAWFGANATKKQKAFNLAVEYAKAA